MLQDEVTRSGRMAPAILAFVFMTPLLPPPTADGVIRLITPTVMTVGLIYLLTNRSMAWTRISREVSRIPQLGRWMAFALGVYALRIVLDQAWGDIEHFVSRLLLVAGLMVFLRWLEVATIPLRSVIQRFLLGYLALAFLIVFIGVTGANLFGEVAPSRGWFGSFVKTTGVPRSSGEVGIMACFAWAAFLVYGRSLRMSLRVAAGVMIPLSLLVVQSRNVILAFVIVTVAWFFSHHEAVVSVGMVVVAFLSPVVVEAVLPTIQSNELGSGIVGEGIYEQNVYTRFELLDDGWRFIAEDPVRTVLGRSRLEWEDYLERQSAFPGSVHNHFLASLINLGFVAGTVSIIALFALPLLRLAGNSRRLDSDARVVFLATLGSVVSLSFYEGFFSPTLMIIWALMWRVAFVRIEPATFVRGRA